MNQIIGTVIEIGNFLSPEAQSIVIQEQFTRKLDSNRTYIIPDFQREIRWDEEQIVELINNIGAGAKFLGNVILSETKRENGNPQSLKDYEIIDAFNILFNLSAVKKQKEIVLSIVSEKKDSADWHVELSSAIQNFLCDTGLTRAKVAMQYKYVDDEFNEEYLSKGLCGSS